MEDSLLQSYIYDNLKNIASFSDSTALCIYEPTKKLYVVKTVDKSNLAYYRKIAGIDASYLTKIVYIKEEEDTAKVVREYISGDSLFDILRSKKHITEPDVVKYAIQICEGLEVLHRNGLVHRDINPNNILISSDGNVKIIDYGIVRSFSESKSSDTVILGTVGYAAPEQFGFNQSDAKTDIYALGVLINVMATGKMPNEVSVEGFLGQIVRKCTRIDSKQRYKSVSELKNALCNKVEGDGFLDKIIREIPGLRSRYTIVTVLSAIAYFVFLLFSVLAFVVTKTEIARTQYTVSWIFTFLIPYFCFHNFLGIWDKLPFSQGSSKRNQRITYTLLGIGSILIGLIVLGLPIT
ncbi:MAG: serine/threonine protein kinase [Lachnospiraceae bacterium]|nr:serine/threonine protein kinase [Lachnospiraceae bacterium]